MAAKFKNPYLQVTEQLIGGSGPKNPYLQHGWGNSAKAKQKEKEYNRKYYEEHKKDKWGVGVGSRLASAPKENKLANGLKRFGQSVNESLQKHNDNWQRGMDMILNKNVTSQTTPASTMQKKKVNPYKATGMAANAQSSGATPSPSQIAQAKKNATPSVQRANAYAQSEQARANQAAKNYRQQNASANRAKANAESAQAAEKQTKFRAEQYENAKKIEQMHKKFEADQNNLRWGQEKRDQQKYMDESMSKARTSNDNKRRQREASRQQQYKDASQDVSYWTTKQNNIQKKVKECKDNITDLYRQYNQKQAEISNGYTLMYSGYGVAPMTETAEAEKIAQDIIKAQNKLEALETTQRTVHQKLEEAKSSPYLKHSWGKSPEQDKLAQKRQQLSAVNMAIRTLEKKSK